MNHAKLSTFQKSRLCRFRGLTFGSANLQFGFWPDSEFRNFLSGRWHVLRFLITSCLTENCEFSMNFLPFDVSANLNVSFSQRGRSYVRFLDFIDPLLPPTSRNVFSAFYPYLNRVVTQLTTPSPFRVTYFTKDPINLKLPRRSSILTV